MSDFLDVLALNVGSSTPFFVLVSVALANPAPMPEVRSLLLLSSSLWERKVLIDCDLASILACVDGSRTYCTQYMSVPLTKPNDTRPTPKILSFHHRPEIWLASTPDVPREPSFCVPFSFGSYPETLHCPFLPNKRNVF